MKVIEKEEGKKRTLEINLQRSRYISRHFEALAFSYLGWQNHCLYYKKKAMFQ
jgi:hypothetical protein